jgi:hypothetical protein
MKRLTGIQHRLFAFCMKDGRSQEMCWKLSWKKLRTGFQGNSL